MQVLLTTPILDYEGLSATLEDRPFTFRDAFMQALSQPTKAEQSAGQGAETKSKIFALSLKLFKAPEVKLTLDEMALLKERCGDISTPLVYGRVCELFEGEDPALPQATS